MKIIVKEHGTILQPIIKKYAINVDALNSAIYIPRFTGLERGDILVYAGEGIVERLPVGTNGQVLTADSNAPLGVKWATPS